MIQIFGLDEDDTMRDQHWMVLAISWYTVPLVFIYYSKTILMKVYDLVGVTEQVDSLLYCWGHTYIIVFVVALIHRKQFSIGEQDFTILVSTRSN